MRVIGLWRYPVKSLQGEPLTDAVVGERGIEGDRRWGIVDVATGLVLTARREPRLLHAWGRLTPDGGAEVVLPDGTTTASDGDLSRWLGRDVVLRAAGGEERATYETPTDFEHEHDAPWVRWQGPVGTFHDSTRTRVSMVSVASMGLWDQRRFRANVVVDESDEDDLVGTTVSVGGCVLDVVKQIDRCVVTTRPQPGGIERDLDVLRTITRERATFLGVGALVRRGGPVTLGDRFVSADADPPADPPDDPPPPAP